MSLRICIPVVETSLDALLSKMEEASKSADIIELWLGELSPKERSLEKIFETKERLKKPLLITVKGPSEKGHFLGTEKEKYEILLGAIQHGAEYIDIGWDFSEEYLSALLSQKQKTEVILSAHFFDGTPSLPALLNRIEIFKKKGADILKIASMAKDKRDLITILRLAENLGRAKQRFIAISMGEIGKPSRVLTPFFGGEMMFAALNTESASAPGQMTAEELRKAWELMVPNS